jgi:hypothetical protein
LLVNGLQVAFSCVTPTKVVFARDSLAADLEAEPQPALLLELGL